MRFFSMAYPTYNLLWQNRLIYCFIKWHLHVDFMYNLRMFIRRDAKTNMNVPLINSNSDFLNFYESFYYEQSIYWGSPITKTRLFKYVENFTSKKLKILDKNSDTFHISAQNIDCGYSLEPPRRGGSNQYPQSMFWAEIRKIMYTPGNPSFTI